jgi:hypothetical protein
MKRTLTIITLCTLITFTSVLGYATINYLLTRTQHETATIGTTTQYEQGIELELTYQSPYNLTYNTIEETDTDKHTITLVYDYTILQGYELSVESSTVEIMNIEDNGTSISIEIGLIQENTYNEGDTLDIVLEFSLEEITLGEFSASNPINVNEATVDQLQSVGFNIVEATDIYNLGLDVNSIIELNGFVYINDYINRFQEWIDLGIIVFE